MIKTLLLIGTGGFAGSISRYLLTKFIATKWPMAFPWGTFSVNIIGCFLIGIIMGMSFQSSISTQTRLLLATGFCGGFTTFSTYSLEIFELYQRGQAGISMLYLFTSILAGFLSVWLGLWVVRVLFQN
jgi:CrcB protein